MASPDAPQTPVTNVYLAEDMSGYFDVERTQPLMTALYQSPQGLYYLDQAHTVRVLLHFTPGRLRGRHIIEYGDIAQSLIKRNADPCTATGCNWSKSKRGFAYVPIKISTRYSMAERQVIIQSLVEFHSVSCIRFVWRLCQHDYLYFFPGNGCWSYVGRQGGRQLVSIQQHGCVYSQVIQHEILHALGFHHEQSRSDRDDFVQIVTENIKPVYLHNFNKVATNNVGTTYDYNSIMHYSRYAFSKEYGVLETIIPKPDATVPIGKATEMSTNDIKRVNQLYQCSEK